MCNQLLPSPYTSISGENYQVSLTSLVYDQVTLHNIFTLTVTPEQRRDVNVHIVCLVVWHGHSHIIYCVNWALKLQCAIRYQYTLHTNYTCIHLDLTCTCQCIETLIQLWISFQASWLKVWRFRFIDYMVVGKLLNLYEKYLCHQN